MSMRDAVKKVLVIGSGPIVIGQAAEFDYAGTQGCLALKEEGIEVILVNNNPATIMTDEQIADRVYMEPLEINTLEKIIAKERPDGLIGTLGGQTSLNLTVKLHEKGILERYGVKLLGTSVQSIQKGEDREKFRQLMVDIGEPVADSRVVETVEEGLAFIKDIGFPVILRPAYTLGGEGGGFANNEQEFLSLLEKGLKLSPIGQVLVERSIQGWKEIEFEVMRDANDTCIIICNMENIDPVGVHTGDSIVVAPSQTLSHRQYHMLRKASIKVIRALEVIGGCNIQFALHPQSNEYFVIEVNPRVSRSSALASKATGYPIARIATKCALGYHLDEIINPITGNTYAATEPALDYVVVKLPRFPFDKFTEGDRKLGTQMKATGEAMALDRTFEGALNKAIRSMELQVNSLEWPGLKEKSDTELKELLHAPNDIRLFAIGEALKRGFGVSAIQALTGIDRWYLRKLEKITQLEQTLSSHRWPNVPTSLLIQAKKINMSDERIASLLQCAPKQLRETYQEIGLQPAFKLVDSCAGEFAAETPYYYSTWNGIDEVSPSEKRKILIVGSGPIRIGQGIEFDYCSVHAAKAVKKSGYEAIIMNNNPETVSTDYSIADRLYFEPLALEDVLSVSIKEQVDGVLLQFGGQTAINLANQLQEEGVPILGTQPEHMDQMENREQFYRFLQSLNIPHIAGFTVEYKEQLTERAKEIGFPVLLRPSYVIGGQSMFICYSEEELFHYVKRIEQDTNGQCWPLLVDPYLPGLECEMDIISDGKDIVVPGIFEHIEKAGVHSGDSMSVLPAQSLSDEVKQQMLETARKISCALPVIGMMNIQFVFHDETLYVLEVNPRSSRTVPFLSKVTGIPMVDWAVQVQLGMPLKKLSDKLGLLPEPSFYTIKAPVFSASKLKGVDHALGPEMKSTGEIIGLGFTKNTALKKVLPYVGKVSEEEKASGRLFVSIADRKKEESLSLVRQFANLNFSICATAGTADFLQQHGINVTKIKNDKAEILDFWQHSPPAIVLNIPNEGRKKEKIGFFIRELSVRHQIPYFTSLETLQAVLDSLSRETAEEEILSLQEYLNRHKILY